MIIALYVGILLLWITATVVIKSLDKEVTHYKDLYLNERSKLREYEAGRIKIELTKK